MARNGQPAPSPVQKVAAELVGTFFVTLVATIVDIAYYTGGGVDYVSRWLARGFIASALIYAFGELSGAHFDPAVSLAFGLRRAMPWRLMLLYWSAQFAGGFAAAGAAYALAGKSMVLGASHPGPHFTQLEAFVAEVVLTFLLMLVIFATAEQEARIGRQAALAVGFTIAACGFFAGPISGASMNPGRSIPPQILGGAFGIVWIYAIGPPLGAALAVLAAKFFFGEPKPGELKAARGK